MRKNLTAGALSCLLVLAMGCSKNSIQKGADLSGQKFGKQSFALSTTNTNGFRGINWADPNGNEGDGRVVLPSGMTTSLTATQAATLATNISSAVKTSGGTTIRMPINPWTASSSTYWPVYQAAINAVVANGCKVILCYWPVGVHHVPDTAQWHTMWTTVNNVYKNNTSVLYEPINEPVDYSSTDLNNLYAGFLTTYSPADGKCIFDGTGYAADVTTVGADSRLANQYLGLHCYWWFWGSYNVWSSYYNIMSARTGSYASRTIVTEVGIETFRNMSFWWQWDTGVYVDQAFLTGSLAYAKDNSMGTIAWSGVNDIDTYRWYTANNNLTEVSPGTANMFRWSWQLSASPVWIGPVADGRYKLQNRASGLMLDNLGSTTDGAAVAQWASGTSNNQKWNISYTAGYYTLSCVTGKECLDVGTNTTDGSNVLQYVVSSSTNQRWSLVSTGDGYYRVINLTTGKCLDTGGLTANGSAVQQWYQGSSYNQQWKLIAQ
ncbi:Ricin-type beta-trefoil lectin domain-like [Mucilaginibacter gossypiicola]|uniref:Ricin-type beta-trefoil lectin domain-like n=1 Tax=Mucilaginibacter gossypiicola TaxID=551995 RepID=A0A1H8TZG9_9SPHI|nr:RICIN domain-containing protein [Mucilaginibacter gossypiicola]SEO95923.1 Ricin-type beta-trefoil lectin domain-like [Mucilaginibacter gossypiicola]